MRTYAECVCQLIAGSRVLGAAAPRAADGAADPAAAARQHRARRPRLQRQLQAQGEGGRVRPAGETGAI